MRQEDEVEDPSEDDEVLDIAPKDAFNEELLRLTHPADWSNPTPQGRYNLVVIGGGTAGLIAALGGAGLGGRVALIEKALMGGDCLNWGCVPSKALIAAARAAYNARNAHHFGVHIDGEVRVDFGAVMERMRRLRAHIAHHDSFERMSRSGIDTYMGHARFTSPNHIDVGGQTLEFSKAIIATGGHAFIPPIPGIEEIGYLTNETLFQITEIPEHLIIIGGGPIGAEMAQSFRRFGARVTLLDMADRLLPRDDPEASQIIMEQFTRESIDFRLGARVSRFRTEDGQKIVCYERDGQMIEVAGDAILISVGRRANVTALNLDAADVAYDRRGIHVDDHLRSITNPNVLASGDVAGSWQFTHAADAMSRIALQNALFFGRKRVSALKMPWATYTDPEVAHVGIPHDEVARRDDVQTFKVPLSGNDRAILEGDTDGFVKVYATSGGALLGGTIVGRDASAMIGELTVALTGGLKLSTIASTIHPYPTTSDAIRAAGNDWNKTRFTPFAAKVLGWVLAARR